MAAESNVKNRICKSCAADVRPAALFCYHCGSSVAPDLTGEIEKKGETEKAETFLRPTIDPGENGIGLSEKIKTERPKVSETAIDKSVEKPFAEPLEIDKKQIAEEKPALKTAAAIRRQAKPPLPEKVEIVWEQPPNAPNIWFLIAAVIIIFFAVGSLLAMLYLR
ncbi:MAG: hypothetical protein ACR2LT_04995 [Pyrinomonadaceae bacterium]